MNTSTFQVSKVKICANRVKVLSDGVIAIVMTLLILDIKLPVETFHTSSVLLWHSLVKLVPSLFAYGLSFLLIASYWIAHTVIFLHVRKIDSGLIWINILFLLTLSFLPFPTELLGYNPHTWVAIAIFDVSISLPALMLLMTVLYVQFSANYSEEWHLGIFKKCRKTKNLRHVGIIPLVAILSFLVSFFSKTVSVYIWSLVLLIKFIEILIERKNYPVANKN